MTPTRLEAKRLESRAAEYLILADQAEDPAVQKDRLAQTAAARAQSARILQALSDAIKTPAPPGGIPVSFGAPNHTPAPVFTTGR